jgi:hypothetical protein
MAVDTVAAAQSSAEDPLLIAISVAYRDRVEVLTLRQSRSAGTLPSFGYLHRSGRRAAGDEAV